MAVDEGAKLVTIGTINSIEEKLTLYSLYK
jgi:hypothetical protein